MSIKISTFLRLNEEIYKNAIRLFIDACCLYQNDSYPSAYFFAMLSFEELGKLEMVAHICDDTLMNADTMSRKDWKRHLFSKGMFYSHKNKQSWAVIQALKLDKNRLKRISNGSFEKCKQNALYVGYQNNRIISPYKIQKQKVYRELKHTINKFREIKDLAFMNLCYESTAYSRKRAKRYNDKVEKLFATLKR